MLDIICDLLYYKWVANKCAAMAQEVERILGKDEVTSSTLVSSSRKNSCSKEQEFFQLYSPFGELYCSAVIFGLRPSDIRFASFGGEYNITFANGKNITMP